MFGFRIHKEGWATIIFVIVLFGGLSYWIHGYIPVVAYIVGFIGLFALVMVLNFFRNPKRDMDSTNDTVVYAPCDGVVVVIEEAEEPEYFKDKRLQISIFMSPLNVHVNRNPIGGVVEYNAYHKGKYLVAWHPKSSTENERTTVVINNGKTAILVRQIAGSVARRIVNYLKVGQRVTQGSEMGFIKFGSRVDVYLPLGTKVDVELNQVAIGNKTVLAHIP